MPQRVYIETTFVSYLTARPNRDVVIAGHQQITHEWWDTRRESYELCVSQLVLGEAGAGDPQAAHDRSCLCGQRSQSADHLHARGTLGAKTMNDPIVDEVRRVRGEHAARFNYDLWAIFRDIQEQQKRSGLTFVSFADEPSGVAPNQPLQQTGPASQLSEV